MASIAADLLKLIRTVSARSTLATVAAAVFLGGFIAAAIYWRCQRSNKVKYSWKDELAETRKSDREASSRHERPVDVWEERRRRGIENASFQKREVDPSKPFTSSYYYAHNTSDSKGGYADGLRMEDYTMNKPRLLSKGGQPVIEDESKKAEMATEPESSLPTRSKDKKKSTPERITQLITKYLWDDPGDSSGVACIRIDELPGKLSTESVAWKDVQVPSVDAKIVGDGGLLVVIKTDTNLDYRLHIKQLYGEVSAVKPVCKPKRLLVKLYKKKGLLDRSNLNAWPHPQKKAV